MFDTNNPLIVPILLMLTVAPLGAVDVIYYHIWKFRLYDQPESRWETVTHLFRAATLALGAIVLFNYEPRGTWFWIVGGVFAFDFVNDIVDVALEKNSRAHLGGLPSLEYVIHIVGSTFAGAITATYFVYAWEFKFLPTELKLIEPNSLPGFIQFSGWALASGAVVLTLLEGSLFIRSICKPPQILGAKNSPLTPLLANNAKFHQ